MNSLTPRSREWLRSTRHVSTSCVAALGLAGTVAMAQTAAPSPSPQQSAQPASAEQVEKVKTQLVEVDTRIRAAQPKE